MADKKKKHAMTLDQETRLYGLSLYIRELADLKKAIERKRHAEEMLEVLGLLAGENMRREAILEVFELFFGERADKEEAPISEYIRDRKASVLERIKRAERDIVSARDNIRKIIPIMNGQIVIGWGDQNFRGITHTSMESLMKKIVNKELITESDLDLNPD
ncbi:MAG: hypothetical protein WC788_07245 [Candidatus Paceibacterota bacterium]